MSLPQRNGKKPKTPNTTGSFFLEAELHNADQEIKRLIILINNSWDLEDWEFLLYRRLVSQRRVFFPNHSMTVSRQYPHLVMPDFPATVHVYYVYSAEYLAGFTENNLYLNRIFKRYQNFYATKNFLDYSTYLPRLSLLKNVIVKSL